MVTSSVGCGLTEFFSPSKGLGMRAEALRGPEIPGLLTGVDFFVADLLFSMIYFGKTFLCSRLRWLASISFRETVASAAALETGSIIEAAFSLMSACGNALKSLTLPSLELRLRGCSSNAPGVLPDVLSLVVGSDTLEVFD
jgi:hypothetical protein